ncbi:MAG TPA: glycosyltransferase family 2 protein [Thermoleophilaceae bacterium]|nr:glycosyltransferase family 2 protein [Thermoleophilaceae bacterium]
MVAVFAGAVGLVAYTFAGYPALVAALARVRPRPVRADPGFTPRVSLIVVAHNEQDVIAERLRNCLELDYPRDRLELIVAADGSDDRTAEIARSFDSVKVLHNTERRGKLHAMNRAAASATGAVLVFSDANNRYGREALRELVAPFADPAVGVVSGRKAIDDGTGRALDQAEGLYWRYESRLKEWETRSGSVTAVAGEIIAFRRESFPEAPPGTVVDDFAQAMLAAADGWRVVYAPRALSLETASATIADEATRRARIVSGRGQALVRLLPLVARRNPRFAFQVVSHKGLRPLVPWALAVAAASSVAPARRRRWARAAVAGQAAFYGAALAGLVAERSGRRSRLLYLPYWFCRMNLATLSGLGDLARGRQDAVWVRVRRG